MPTAVVPSNAEVERVERINQDLIRFGEGVTRRNQDDDSGIGDFNEYFVESSYLLAEMGVLGGGNGGNDIYSGPATTAEAMALAEQFMESLDGSRRFADVHVIYRKVFRRLVKTDMSPLPVDEQIAITHGALLVVEPYMPRDVIRGITATLDRQGGAYIDDVVITGTIGPDVSYPEYLEQHGFRNWIGPGLTPEEIEDAF
jgi:hypothetical protein